MKKAMSLFLSLAIVLSAAVLPAAAYEDPRTEVTTYDLYLEAIQEYDGYYQDILFEMNGTAIYNISRPTYFSHYRLTKEAFDDYSQVNSYLRFYKAMKACHGVPKTAQELRDYNWKGPSYQYAAMDRWFNITDSDFDRWYADYQNGVDPGPDPDKTEITQEGDRVTFYNPDYGYSLTLGPVLSYEDVEIFGETGRIYHLTDDGSATASVRNINCAYHLFGYDNTLCGYSVNYGGYAPNVGGGAIWKIQQCAPGSEVSWTFSGTSSFYDLMYGTEEWLVPFYWNLFPSIEKDPKQDDWYNYIYSYDVYFVTDGGRVSYNNKTIDGIPFEDYLVRERVNSTVGGFSDVKKSDYFSDAVLWAVNHTPQITNGVGGDKFGATNTVTRSQAVTFLWRAANCPEPKSMTSPFSDVTDAGTWYYKAVLWAAEKGITNGNGGGKFGVNDTLAYDQMLTFMCRAAGGDTSGDWSGKAIKWAADNGLTDGLTITAKGNCPRSDVVYCLWKEMA